LRVHELARELNVQSKDILAALEEMGLGGRTASSSVPDEAIPRLRASGGKPVPGGVKPKVQAVEPLPERKPTPEPEPEELEEIIDEGVEQLATLAEQVIHEAEAIAGEAAHNFQVAMKAATGAQGVIPTLSGINSYLYRSVQINARFMEQFTAIRSPIDLVNLQVHFLEEHRIAMLEFTQQWTMKKSAS